MSTIRPDAPIAPEPAMIDGIFRALADPTRRQVLERLGERPASVSELAAHHPMALPSFLAHLKVLEGCGLVHSRKHGRVRTYSLAPDRLRLAEDLSLIHISHRHDFVGADDGDARQLCGVDLLVPAAEARPRPTAPHRHCLTPRSARDRAPYCGAPIVRH